MPKTKKELISTPAAHEQINTTDNDQEPTFFEDYSNNPEKWGDFGPQYHVLAVCCGNRDYKYLGESTCTDGWHETRQACLSCGNHFAIWRAPQEGDRYE
jgi:hypothetical protein